MVATFIGNRGHALRSGRRVVIGHCDRDDIDRGGAMTGFKEASYACVARSKFAMLRIVDSQAEHQFVAQIPFGVVLCWSAHIRPGNSWFRCREWLDQD